MSVAPLNVAFLVSSDGRSGTYFRYHNLARALARRGHAVTVYSQSPENRRRATTETREDGVRYVLPASCPGNSFFDFALNPGNLLRRALVRVWPADVYHLFQPMENAAWQWRWLQQWPTKTARFFWDWDDLWFGGLLPAANATWRVRHLGKLERTLPARAEIVTTCSQFLADLARERGARRTEVIHNGFWPENLAPPLNPAERTARRVELGLRPDAFYLGFTGWTAGEIEWCLEALARLPENVRLACCGYDARRNLGNFPPALGERVDYLGEVSAERARQIAAVLDASLLPLAPTDFNRSRLPIKFADSLAAGVPVIAGDIGEVGQLGRALAGAVLVPAERAGWVSGGVAAVGNIQENPAAFRPDPVQLRALLDWNHLGERLETLYRAPVASR